MDPHIPGLFSDLWPILLGLLVGTFMGAIAMALFGSRNAYRSYRRGCKDTEDRLIGTTRDHRHDTTSARLPHTTP